VPRRAVAARLLLLTLVLALGGCTLIDQLSPSKRAARRQAQQLQSLQLTVMRFADEYVGRSGDVIQRLQDETENPEERLLAQNFRVSQATAAYTIASGPNPVSNALDMIALASLSRMVLDDVWVRENFGARAQPVDDTYRSLEAEAWQLVDGILTDAQEKRLKEIMAQWRALHPHVRAVSYLDFRDFAQSIGAPKPGEEGQSGNLFAMLGIDPFSSLDPALREITQSRQLAERGIYYLQRAPSLLDLQVTRLTYQLAVMPETRGLLADANRASLIGSASDELVRNLPALLDRQREALLAQVTALLNQQGPALGGLARDLRGTLEAGTQTADALHGTLEVFERISTQLSSKPEQPAAERGPPFDIRNYTEMLREATAASRELNALATRSDALLPLVRLAGSDAAGQLNAVLNHLFLLAALLVLLTTAAVLAALLAYRRLAARTALPR